MATPFDPRFLSRLRRFARAASAAVFLVGSLVLVGWVSDRDALTSVIPGLVAMNPLTALAFILAGVSVWQLAGPRRAEAGTRRIAWTCAALVMLAASLKLNGYLFNQLFSDRQAAWDLGIDRLLFGEKLDAADPPNRMAPNTALNFLLIAPALLFLDVETRRYRRPAQLAAWAATLVSLLAIVGYACSAMFLYGVGPFISMALNTAIAFALVSLGILCAPRPGTDGIYHQCRGGGCDGPALAAGGHRHSRGAWLAALVDQRGGGGRYHIPGIGLRDGGDRYLHQFDLVECGVTRSDGSEAQAGGAAAGGPVQGRTGSGGIAPTHSRYPHDSASGL
jgi:hypothetical protein